MSRPANTTWTTIAQDGRRLVVGLGLPGRAVGLLVTYNPQVALHADAICGGGCHERAGGPTARGDGGAYVPERAHDWRELHPLRVANRATRSGALVIKLA